MRCPIPSTRSGTLRARRIAPLLVPLFLLAAGVLLLPGNARGGMFQTVGPTPFGDDLHSASLNPYPAIAVSTIASNPPGQCAWINAGLNAFLAANPANGTGPSGQGWSYTWAGAAAEAKVEAGIKILDYFPFVVFAPKVTAAPGSQPTAANPNGARVFPQRASGELGGAVINLQYTPQAGAPAITNLHWIQAYTGTTWGVNVPPLLDNDPNNAYKSQATITPFYDAISPGAGTLAGGGGWFEDRPQVPEFDVYYTKKEYESNPVASVQFQVVLVSDTQSVVGGVTQNALTLYGGEWWGFTYSAVDTPEPASLTLLGLGTVSLAGYGWRQRKRVA